MLSDVRKGRVEVALAAGIHDMNQLSYSAGCLLNFSQYRFVVGVGRIYQHGNRAARGEQLAQSSSRFAVTTGEKLIAPVAFPPGRARLVTRPYFTGSPPPVKTIGMVEVAALATTAGCKPPVATITAT